MQTPARTLAVAARLALLLRGQGLEEERAWQRQKRQWQPNEAQCSTLWLACLF